jgi:hypothetical protein
VDFSRYGQGFGRELLANFRAVATTADAGATAITFLPEPPA